MANQFTTIPNLLPTFKAMSKEEVSSTPLALRKRHDDADKEMEEAYIKAMNAEIPDELKAEYREEMNNFRNELSNVSDNLEMYGINSSDGFSKFKNIKENYNKDFSEHGKFGAVARLNNNLELFKKEYLETAAKNGIDPTLAQQRWEEGRKNFFGVAKDINSTFLNEKDMRNFFLMPPKNIEIRESIASSLSVAKGDLLRSIQTSGIDPSTMEIGYGQNGYYLLNPQNFKDIKTTSEILNNLNNLNAARNALITEWQTPGTIENNNLIYKGWNFKGNVLPIIEEYFNSAIKDSLKGSYEVIDRTDKSNRGSSSKEATKKKEEKDDLYNAYITEEVVTIPEEVVNDKKVLDTLFDSKYEIPLDDKTEEEKATIALVMANAGDFVKDSKNQYLTKKKYDTGREYFGAQRINSKGKVEEYTFNDTKINPSAYHIIFDNAGLHKTSLGGFLYEYAREAGLSADAGNTLSRASNYLFNLSLHKNKLLSELKPEKVSIYKQIAEILGKYPDLINYNDVNFKAKKELLSKDDIASLEKLLPKIDYRHINISFLDDFLVDNFIPGTLEADHIDYIRPAHYLKRYNTSKGADILEVQSDSDGTFGYKSKSLAEPATLKDVRDAAKIQEDIAKYLIDDKIDFKNKKEYFSNWDTLAKMKYDKNVKTLKVKGDKTLTAGYSDSADYLNSYAALMDYSDSGLQFSNTKIYFNTYNSGINAPKTLDNVNNFTNKLTGIINSLADEVKVYGLNNNSEFSKLNLNNAKDKIKVLNALNDDAKKGVHIDNVSINHNNKVNAVFAWEGAEKKQYKIEIPLVYHDAQDKRAGGLIASLVDYMYQEANSELDRENIRMIDQYITLGSYRSLYKYDPITDMTAINSKKENRNKRTVDTRNIISSLLIRSGSNMVGGKGYGLTSNNIGAHSGYLLNALFNSDGEALVDRNNINGDRYKLEEATFVKGVNKTFGLRVIGKKFAKNQKQREVLEETQYYTYKDALDTYRLRINAGLSKFDSLNVTSQKDIMRFKTFTNNPNIVEPIQEYNALLFILQKMEDGSFNTDVTNSDSKEKFNNIFSKGIVNELGAAFAKKVEYIDKWYNTKDDADKIRYEEYIMDIEAKIAAYLNKDENKNVIKELKNIFSDLPLYSTSLSVF